MTKINEWFKNLDLEIIIIFIAIFILIILVLYILGKSNKIYAAIAKKTLKIKEDLIHQNDEYLTRAITTNIGYTNAIIKELGFIYKKTKLPLKTDEFSLIARDSYNTTIDINELREFVLGDNNKVKKFHFYVVDSVNRTSKTKMKLSYKYIKGQIDFENSEAKRIENEKRMAEKLALKQQRYSTGDYNFGDRLTLIIKAIFSPFGKLVKFINRKINQKLRKREIKKEVKKELKEKYRIENLAATEKQEQDFRGNVQDKFKEKLDKKQAKKDAKNIVEEKIELNEDVEVKENTPLDQVEIDDESNELESSESEEMLENDDAILDVEVDLDEELSSKVAENTPENND